MMITTIFVAQILEIMNMNDWREARSSFIHYYKVKLFVGGSSRTIDFFVLEGPIQFYELAVVPSTYLPIYVIKSHIFYMNILAIVHIFWQKKFCCIDCLQERQRQHFLL